MTKKNEMAEGRNGMVSVDLAELSRGLEAAFTGVAMVFGSLGRADAGTELASVLSKSVMPAVGEKQSEETTETTGTSKTVETAETAEQAVSAAEQTVNAETVEEADTAAESTAFTESKSSAEQTTPAAHVSVDDITKVIVAKIKQKRDNNARIGALLKTYGADKVSSLSPEKYEAFLTDISQL